MTALTPTSEAGGRLARRRQERERRRRARRRLAQRVLAGVGALIVVGVVAVATLAVLGRTGDGGAAHEPAADERAGTAPASGEQDTLLLVRTRDDGQAAASATLLAVNDGGATVVLIPTGMLVDVPGVGLDRLALAGQYGGPRLVQASVENLLGIAIDHVATVDGPGLAAWLNRLGGLEVEVARKLRGAGSDGQPVRFEPGAQTLNGAQLTRYASFVGDEGELDVITRQRKMFAALLEAVGDPPARAALMDGSADGSWPVETAAGADWMDRLLARAGDAQAADAARFRMLPVEAVSGDGPDGRPTYRADADETAELTRQHLAASVPDEAAGGAPRVQVLNGVGTPGIGGAVEDRVGGGRVRIVASDNAPSFGEDTTRIVIYDDSDRSRATAEWVQQQLGVGTIQVSRQPQSVVDVTIVVGADFSP